MKVGGKVATEQPAQGESQSNGVIEEAGKTVREFVRLLKDVLESNMQTKIGTREPIMQWAVRWAAMLVSRYLVGKDGRTAQERKRGRTCKIPLAEFGEVVWYRPIDKNRDKKQDRDQMGKRNMAGNLQRIQRDINWH